MALVNKRIIDLPERTILRSDDYVAVDSSDGGTAKYNITELETAVDDVAPIIVNTSPTASVLALTDGAEDKAVKRLTLNLLPHQAGSGVPSPSNVRAISGYNAIDVVRTGKNLLDNVQNESVNLSSVTFTKQSDGTVVANGKATSNAWYKFNTEKLIFPVPVVISGATGGSSSTYEMQATTGSAQYHQYSEEITIPANTPVDVYIGIRNGYTASNLTFHPMIRLASISDPTYEPYQSDTYPITLPQTVYGGELDVVSGKLKVTHGYTVFDGSDDEDWAQSGDNRMLTSISGSYAEGYTRIAVTANRGVFGTGSAVGTTFLSNQSLYYYQPTDITTASAFRSWLASNNLQVVYPLATPTEITLDPTTIKTLLGTNTIWMSADGTIQAEYCADTKMYIDALTAPDDDMVANSNIENGKYFTVNNKLYISTSAIAQGEQIVVGTNCNQTDLATALNAINS